METNQEISLEDIKNQCMDAPGYVIFAGILSKELDKNGRQQINFIYRRHQFTFEDTKGAVSEFKNQFSNDVGGL